MHDCGRLSAIKYGDFLVAVEGADDLTGFLPQVDE
jgi:hypothetical protein